MQTAAEAFDAALARSIDAFGELHQIPAAVPRRHEVDLTGLRAIDVGWLDPLVVGLSPLDLVLNDEVLALEDIQRAAVMFEERARCVHAVLVAVVRGFMRSLVVSGAHPSRTKTIAPLLWLAEQIRTQRRALSERGTEADVPDALSRLTRREQD